MKTHSIGNSPPIHDPPPPPSLNNPITTQPSSSRSPYQYNNPPNYPPPNTIATQPSRSQIHQTLPAILLSFTNVITTQPQGPSSQTYLPKTLSANANPSPLLTYLNCPPQHFQILCLRHLHVMTHTHHFIQVFIFNLPPLFNLLFYLPTLFHHLVLCIKHIRRFFQVMWNSLCSICCSLRSHKTL